MPDRSGQRGTRAPSATGRGDVAGAIAQATGAGPTSPESAPGTTASPGSSSTRASEASDAPAGGPGHPPSHITPEQALENTRKLLAAKQANARKPPPWQEHGDNQAVPVPKPGFESESARVQALELHQDEMRLSAIEGSISDRDRRQQGKRDSR